MGSRNLIDAAPTLRRGGSDSTVTRTCRATGEALLVPARNRRSRVDRITGSTGKSIEGERVTDGFAVALKRVTPAERRSPAVCKVSGHKEGKDEMTKASIDLQDLRRRIYVKAKAETSWRFWGLSPETAGLRLDAGNPHAAFDEAGAGNAAWSRWSDTRRRKSEPTGNTNFDLNRRARLRPYRESTGES